MLQVSIIYFHAAIGKLNNAEWLDGTCIYYWFTNNVFGAPIWLQKVYSVITLSKFVPIFTWSVIILELSLFACLFVTNHYLKNIFLILGIIFHLGIVVTHGLPTFFFSMTGALILYLGNPDIIDYYILNIKYKIYKIYKI
jgi:antimicrobial peptide system SdpB family protein